MMGGMTGGLDVEHLGSNARAHRGFTHETSCSTTKRHEVMIGDADGFRGKRID
jgi:hypothetical protein